MVSHKRIYASQKEVFILHVAFHGNHFILVSCDASVASDSI